MSSIGNNGFDYSRFRSVDKSTLPEKGKEYDECAQKLADEVAPIIAQISNYHELFNCFNGIEIVTDFDKPPRFDSDRIGFCKEILLSYAQKEKDDLLLVYHNGAEWIDYLRSQIRSSLLTSNSSELAKELDPPRRELPKGRLVGYLGI